MKSLQAKLNSKTLRRALIVYSFLILSALFMAEFVFIGSEQQTQVQASSNCFSWDLQPGVKYAQATDYCRGTQTGGNCQKCSAGAVNCDIECGKPGADPAKCYVKGDFHFFGVDAPEKRTFCAPDLACGNTQIDLLQVKADNTLTYLNNATWQDGREWNACFPPTVVPTTIVPTVEPAADFTISKVAPAGNGPYLSGQTVEFVVKITNIGETAFTQVSFRDEYDTQKLALMQIFAIDGSNVTAQFTVDPSLGVITHADLTTFLGDLAPGASYNLIYKFRALQATSSTCNIAKAIPAGQPQKSAKACVSIDVQSPSTDL